ncbi:MAG: hypothetical protein CSA95_05015 [Bacteroidetes bacterium]|nr:MAG: hypothetical protein CSA95_05015 [Bacteroidota bacterium]
MKKASRSIGRVSLLLIAVTLILFIYLRNRQKHSFINPQSLTGEFPSVIASDAPLDFLQALKKYEPIPNILPTHKITSTQKLISKIHDHKIPITQVIWLYDPHDKKFAFLINTPKDPIPALAPYKSTDTPHWHTEWLKEGLLCAEDNELLPLFKQRIQRDLTYQGKKDHHKEGHTVSISDSLLGIPALHKASTIIFDLYEYRHKLYLNGLGDLSSAQKPEIPVSGGFSSPIPLQGNSRANLRYHEKAPIISIELSHSSTTTPPPSSPSTSSPPKEEEKELFAVLEAPIKRGPFLVESPQTNTQNLIAFDLHNNMYYFNEKGELLWKKEFDDPITGSLFQVAPDNSGKQYFLWNSRENIHLIDHEGREKEGYPFPLPGKARKEVSLIQERGGKSAHILYLDTAGNLTKVTLSPAIAPHWHQTNISFPVSTPITYLEEKQHQYSIVAGDNGEVLIIKPTGKVHITIKKSFKNNVLSDFYINKTNNKGMLMTTSHDGTLTYLSNRGKIRTTNFGSFSEQHFFFYVDFDNDGHHDFLYIDQGEITVYNRFKKTIFTHTLAYDVQQKPRILTINQESVLGIVDDTQFMLFLYTREGKKDIAIPCEGHFEYSPTSLSIYTALGKKIYRKTLSNA